MPNVTVVKFFSHIIVLMCRLVRANFEQLNNEGFRFIFSVLFLSGTITRNISFSNKRKIFFFPSLSQVYFLARKICEIVQFAKKSLKIINLALISHNEACVQNLHLYMNGYSFVGYYPLFVCF